MEQYRSLIFYEFTQTGKECGWSEGTKRYRVPADVDPVQEDDF
jgi:hypothetical protein